MTKEHRNETVPVVEEAPDFGPAVKALVQREAQLTAVRKAMTMTQWAGVCEELPAAQDWFDDEGNLR